MRTCGVALAIGTVLLSVAPNALADGVIGTVTKTATTAVPGVTLPTPPTATTPPVTVPSVTVPSVTVPPVTVPPIQTPVVTTPSATRPAVTTSAVTTAAVTVPRVTVPSVSVPSAKAAPVKAARAATPAAAPATTTAVATGSTEEAAARAAATAKHARARRAALQRRLLARRRAAARARHQRAPVHTPPARTSPTPAAPVPGTPTSPVAASPSPAPPDPAPAPVVQHASIPAASLSTPRDTPATVQAATFRGYRASGRTSLAPAIAGGVILVDPTSGTAARSPLLPVPAGFPAPGRGAADTTPPALRSARGGRSAAASAGAPGNAFSFGFPSPFGRIELSSSGVHRSGSTSPVALALCGLIVVVSLVGIRRSSGSAQTSAS